MVPRNLLKVIINIYYSIFLYFLGLCRIIRTTIFVMFYSGSLEYSYINSSNLIGQSEVTKSISALVSMVFKLLNDLNIPMLDSSTFVLTLSPRSTIVMKGTQHPCLCFF